MSAGTLQSERPAVELALEEATRRIITKALVAAWDALAVGGYPRQAFELFRYTLNRVALGQSIRYTTNRTSQYAL